MPKAANSKKVKDKAEFLREPRNFKVALEVFSAFDEVREKLRDKYWNKLWRLIGSAIRKNPQRFDGWRIERHGQPGDNYHAIKFVPANAPDPGLYCYAQIEQSTLANRYGISLGIHWSEYVGHDPMVAELDELRDFLRKTHDIPATNRHWWVGQRSEGYGLYEPAILQQLARDNTLERLQASSFIDLFLSARPRVVTLNRRLRRA